MDDLRFVIDIQGFHGKNGEFLPKEIAVVGVDYTVDAHWIIKPPYRFCELGYAFSTANTYLSCHEHGIEWFDGESNLEDVYKTLRDVARRALQIYAWGSTNQKLLQQVLSRRVINLQDLHCPSYKNLPYTNSHSCFHHTCIKEFMVCALSFAYKLRNWLKTEADPIQKIKVVGSQDVIDLEKKRIECIKRQAECLIDGNKETEELVSSIDGKSTSTPISVEESHGFEPNITSSPKHTGSNSGSVSRGQNTLPVDETVCICC